MKKLPNTIYVYACDYDDDQQPIYAVVTDVNELPEDCEGEVIGTYTFTKSAKLQVTRSLKE